MLGPSRANTSPGWVHSCPAEPVTDATYAAAVASARVGEGAGQQEHRVDRRHLGVDGDRFRPLLGSGDQGQTALAGAGESDRPDARVADQGRAQLVRRPVQQREGALRETVLGHGLPEARPTSSDVPG